ncbi:MAG TPA: MaoC/PaaZ C-terminal domain-containing protein [Acidimicrobiia bacterium]|nr:MaoC/PaaZ C-terminal domain-containing protein [Acidimicrobiia bacterium]
MPIDVGKVGGARLPDLESSWDETGVILYHLGIGAGDPPTSESELSYCYEPNLKVLPSFATIPPFEALAHVPGLDGMDVNPMKLLHGEHQIEIHRQLPVTATVKTVSRITGVHDKGKGALIVVESISSDQGGPLFTNRASLFARGEGGFDPTGSGQVASEDETYAPDRPADLVVEVPTIPQQALLYRLNGDRNPLHADPAFAALGGFERPILHGLCSFGMVCKAVVDHALGGRVGSVAEYRARFSGVVFPGETLLVSMWRESEIVHLAATTKERSLPVLTSAYVRASV